MAGTQKRMRQFTLYPCSSSNANLSLTDLPIEILVDIFLRLPVKSLCSIECVSKTMFNLIYGPFSTTLLRRLLTSTKAVADRAPQLMLFSRMHRREWRDGIANCGELTALQSLKYDGNALTKDQHAIDFSKILSTNERINNEEIYRTHFVFGNLVCLKHKTDHGRCFLINPVRGEVLKLPNSNLQVTEYGAGTTSETMCEWFGMGFDNITSTHKIVRVSLHMIYNATRTFVVEEFHAQVLILGTSSWRVVKPAVPFFLNHLGPAHSSARNVSAYGDTHWLISCRRKERKGHSHILSFDFKEEEFYWFPHPKIKGYSTKVFILTLRGSMAIVDTSSRRNIKIWVLKDYDKKEWTRDYTIKIARPEFWCFRREIFTCAEWDHGIFFKEIYDCNSIKSYAYCLDLRLGSLKPLECPVLTWSEEKTWIFSLRG